MHQHHDTARKANRRETSTRDRPGTRRMYATGGRVEAERAESPPAAYLSTTSG